MLRRRAPPALSHLPKPPCSRVHAPSLATTRCPLSSTRLFARLRPPPSACPLIRSPPAALRLSLLPRPPHVTSLAALHLPPSACPFARHPPPVSPACLPAACYRLLPSARCPHLRCTSSSTLLASCSVDGSVSAIAVGPSTDSLLSAVRRRGVRCRSRQSAVQG